MSFRFDEAEVRGRAAGRLHASPLESWRRSDDDLNPHAPMIAEGISYRPAAVLVPLVLRPAGLTVLLTERQPHLRTHAGQVAFPGGRMDETDTSAVDTALRETLEETGITPELVEPIGFLDPYLTLTAYRVVPVVGVVQPGFTAIPFEGEVADIFEVPLAFLMDAQRHEMHSREVQGKLRHYYAMTYEGRYIWGATAGMIRNLYHLLYETP